MKLPKLPDLADLDAEQRAAVFAGLPETCDHGKPIEQECLHCEAERDQDVTYCDHGKPVGHWCDECRTKADQERAAALKHCHGCGVPVRGGMVSPCTFCCEQCLCCVKCTVNIRKGDMSLAVTNCAAFEVLRARYNKPQRLDPFLWRLALIFLLETRAAEYRDLAYEIRTRRESTVNRGSVLR